MRNMILTENGRKWLLLQGNSWTDTMSPYHLLITLISQSFCGTTIPPFFLNLVVHSFSFHCYLLSEYHKNVEERCNSYIGVCDADAVS